MSKKVLLIIAVLIAVLVSASLVAAQSQLPGSLVVRPANPERRLEQCLDLIPGL